MAGCLILNRSLLLSCGSYIFVLLQQGEPYAKHPEALKKSILLVFTFDHTQNDIFFSAFVSTIFLTF